MNTKYIYVGISLLVLLIGLTVYLFVRESDGDVLSPTPVVTVKEFPQAPQGKINVAQKGDTFIAVNNVFGEQASSAEKPLSITEDNVTQTKTVLLARTDEYDLVAFSSTASNATGGSFLITISSYNIAAARAAAEIDIAKRLGVELQTLCDIPIRVVVPRPFDENLTQNEIGISFCSGSQAL